MEAAKDITPYSYQLHICLDKYKTRTPTLLLAPCRIISCLCPVELSSPRRCTQIMAIRTEVTSDAHKTRCHTTLFSGGKSTPFPKVSLHCMGAPIFPTVISAVAVWSKYSKAIRTSDQAIEAEDTASRCTATTINFPGHHDNIEGRHSFPSILDGPHPITTCVLHDNTSSTKWHRICPAQTTSNHHNQSNHGSRQCPTTQLQAEGPFDTRQHRGLVIFPSNTRFIERISQ
ncbi:hypothetical protein EV424DRAFT_104177 [Suillus variegatus]|nr:hypothetical protein EV424DRAFT_104177 [Suillus variegatus]